MSTSTLRSLLADIIEVIDTLEALKSPNSRQSEFARKVAEAMEKAQENGTLPEGMGHNVTVIGYTKEESAEAAACLTEAFVAAQQVNPEYTDAPADDHTITIGFVAQGDPEETPAQAVEPEPAPAPSEIVEPQAAPAKTRKPRQPKAPKPEPVDYDAVRGEVASSISTLVEMGKKNAIKGLLAKYEADRAREIPDEKIAAFRDELVLL